MKHTNCNSCLIWKNLALVRLLEEQWHGSEWEYQLKMKIQYALLVDAVRESTAYEENGAFAKNFDSWWEFNQDYVGNGGDNELLDDLEILLAKFGVIHA